MYQKTILKNGLRLLTIPQQESLAVTVLVLVGTGSKYEKKEENGISHFLEHMFFKGTKKRPSSTAIAEALDKVGGIYNAFTSEEYTGYFAKVKAEFLDLALDWVSDIFLNSKLEPAEIEKEKGVIFEEINMCYDHPMSYIGILWHKLLYGDQPAGWDVAGTKESVAKINRQKLINYRRTQYTASNTVICVSGKFKSGLFEKIKRYFSGLKTKLPQPKPPVKERQSTPQCLLEQRNTDQTHLYLGTRGYHLFHPDKYAQEILATILGGMMSSRLFIKIREKLGLAYYITTSAAFYTDTGYLVTRAGVRNDKVEKAISVILKEYRELSQKKVPVPELKKVKKYLKGKMALSLESSEAKASFYGVQELLKKEILTPEQIYAEIDKVTSNDILRVARSLFQNSKLNLALIGPFGDKKKFQQLLKF